jgi:hypothetical protein
MEMPIAQLQHLTANFSCIEMEQEMREQFILRELRLRMRYGWKLAQEMKIRHSASQQLIQQ